MILSDLEIAIADLERSLERLHALYNQYFMGIEKLEPIVPRKEVDRKIQALRRQKIKNTAIRFRLQTQIQKYNTQSVYWRRVCKQIEEGTYQRQVMLAKRRRKAREDHADIPTQEQESAEAALHNEEEAPPVYQIDLDEPNDMMLDEPFSDPGISTVSAVNPIESLDDPFGDELGSSQVQTNADPSAETTKKKPEEALQFDDKEIQDFFSASLAPPPPPEKDSQVQPRPKRGMPRPRVTVSNTPARRASPPKKAVKKAAKEAVKKAPAKIAPGPVKESAKIAPAKIAPEPVKKAVKKAPAKKAPEPINNGFDENRARKIYRTYVAARKKCNESTANLSLEKVAKTLDTQYRSKSGAVDFKVIIRGGKAVIKTIKK